MNALRECGRKRRHADEASARRHLAALQPRRRRSYHVYRCTVCGSFHVGRRSA